MWIIWECSQQVPLLGVVLDTGPFKGSNHLLPQLKPQIEATDR